MNGAWLVSALAAAAAALTLFNVATWPRPRSAGRVPPVSVLIPARNEERTIEACVRAALAEPVAEVVVLDDRSTDATAAILAGIQAETHDPRLRVVSGRPLAAGWVGKAHACARLAEEAAHERLLFVDADTVLLPGAVAGLADLHDRLDADVVTAFPAQVTGSLAERVMMPLLHVTYTSWLPLVLVHKTSHPAVLAANGQVLSIGRDALAAIGGFAAIRHEVVDDMALCRAIKQAGRRVVFADGAGIARCRMYTSGGELWNGFAKNLYEGLGSPVGLLGVTSLYGLSFVVPWVALAASPWAPSIAAPAAVAVAANVAQRLVIALRYRQSLWPIVLHPLEVVALIALAFDSFVRSQTGRITWKGRVYANRKARGA